MQIVYIFIALFGIGIIFQNCSQERVNPRVYSLASECPDAFAKSSFNDSSKIFISPEISDQDLTQKKISIVFDSQCVAFQNKEIYIFDQTILFQSNGLNLAQQAVELNWPVEVSRQQMEAEISQQKCVLGVFENIDFTTSQLVGDNNLLVDPEATNQAHLKFVGLDESLQLQEKIKTEVIVAVIDTGVDYEHEDLKQRLWKDPVGNFGINFVDNNKDPFDDDGHGTHIAGLIVAERDNGFAVSGLTGKYTKIMAIKALSSQGMGRAQDIYNGIRYAIENGADIINLSIFSEGLNPMIESGVIEAVKSGVVVVLSIGNQSRKLTKDNLVTPAYLGRALNGVIAVASVDTSTSDVSFFSNYGLSYAEMAAPGAEQGGQSNGGLLSTMPGQTWERMRGTSQSAPIVSALAATAIGHLKSESVPYTPTLIEEIILQYGVTKNNNIENRVIAGRVANLGILSNNLSSPEVMSKIKSLDKYSGVCGQP